MQNLSTRARSYSTRARSYSTSGRSTPPELAPTSPVLVPIPPPSPDLSPPGSPFQIPTLLAPHADGLVPYLGSHLDLPPNTDVMPPGFLGFVFAFPDGVVVRTTARRAYIVDGWTASHSLAPRPPPGDLIMINDPMDITFPAGGRIIVSNDGFIFVQNHRPMQSPHGCEIVVPVGGVAEFRLSADDIDTSSAPV